MQIFDSLYEFRGMFNWNLEKVNIVKEYLSIRWIFFFKYEGWKCLMGIKGKKWEPFPIDEEWKELSVQ